MQNPQWQVRLFLPCFRASTCELRSGLKPQRLAAQGLFRGMQYEKRRLSLFGCEKFSTNAARGFYIPVVMIQNQIEAQCNGFDLERRNSVVSKFSHMCGSERYGACSAPTGRGTKGKCETCAAGHRAEEPTFLDAYVWHPQSKLRGSAYMGILNILSALVQNQAGSCTYRADGKQKETKGQNRTFSSLIIWYGSLDRASRSVS